MAVTVGATRSISTARRAGGGGLVRVVGAGVLVGGFYAVVSSMTGCSLSPPPADDPATRPTPEASSRSPAGNSGATPSVPASPRSIAPQTRQARASAEPVRRQLPKPERGNQTRQYLQGEGSLLVVAQHQAGVRLLAVVSASECRALAKDLNARIAPAQAYDLTAGIPDEPTQVAFTRERTAIAIRLTDCISGLTKKRERVPDLALAVGTVDLRLDDLGVQR